MLVRQSKDALLVPVAVYLGGFVRYQTFVEIVDDDGSVSIVPATLTINSDCLDTIDC